MNLLLCFWALLSVSVLGYRIPPRIESSSLTLGKQPRIINGINAGDNEFPFMVSLEINYEGINFSCGGVLISNTWVLTVAHCMYPSDRATRPDEVKVGYGSSKRSLQTLVDAKSIYVYPGFNPNSEIPYYDIALIELASSISLDGSKTQSIQISSQILPARTPTTSLGWGAVSNDLNAGSVNDLQKVELLVGGQEFCQSILSNYTQGGNFVCTSTDPGGFDTCYGDSGAPLLYREANGQLTVVGVLSYGDNPSHPDTPLCGDPTGASFFTRPDFYLNYIALITGLSPDKLVFGDQSQPTTLISPSISGAPTATSLPITTFPPGIVFPSCSTLTTSVTVYVTVTENNQNNYGPNGNYITSTLTGPLPFTITGNDGATAEPRDFTNNDLQALQAPNMNEMDPAEAGLLLLTVSLVDIVTEVETV